MTATDELLPCPFCGGEAELRYHPMSMRDPQCRAWEVGCSLCSARVGCTIYAIGKTRDDAIAAWNRRAEPSQPTHRDELVDYLCDMCANDCDERKVIRVGQGAYDVCERWKESDHD